MWSGETWRMESTTTDLHSKVRNTSMVFVSSYFLHRPMYYLFSLYPLKIPSPFLIIFVDVCLWHLLITFFCLLYQASCSSTPSSSSEADTRPPGRCWGGLDMTTTWSSHRNTCSPCKGTLKDTRVIGSLVVFVWDHPPTDQVWFICIFKTFTV